jgi:hypothetical protein
MALYQPYPLLNSNSDYGQAANSSGDPVFGEFLSWFSQSSGSSTFYSYSSYLQNALAHGAFVSRFHNAQIRQLDAGINFFRQQGGYGGEAYNLSLDPLFRNLLSNTAFMLSNLNARIRRIDQTLDSVFQAADLFSSSTLTDNYINDTFWPSSFEMTPPLTDNPVNFALSTYVGDANVIYPVTTRYMNVQIGAGTTSYVGSANQIIFSVTNAGLINSFGVRAGGEYAVTIGTGIFTAGSSYMVFASLSNYDIANLSITGNFVSTITFLMPYTSNDLAIV